MKLIRDLEPPRTEGAFAGAVRLESSTCYDFVVSLRALFNPRTFVQQRRWAAAQLPRLGQETLVKGKFLFQGFDTALGYGALRVVGRLKTPSPGTLIDAVRSMAPTELAMFMLDTGETSRERLELFQAVLDGDESSLGEAVQGLPSGWATRCRRVLRDPAGVQRDLLEVFDSHLANIYSRHGEQVSKLIEDAKPSVSQLLAVLPPEAAIERLTGGYTLGVDLGLREITLAPSVFIHPFMSARVDEERAEALIVYPLSSDIFDGYDPVPVRRDLVAALKAISDTNRLTLLKLLAGQPLYTADLVQRLALGQPTVHHHLAQLRTAGLIRQERDRHGMKYSIRTESAKQLMRSLEEWILGPSSQ